MHWGQGPEDAGVSCCTIAPNECPESYKANGDELYNGKMGLSLMGPWAETISEQSLSGRQTDLPPVLDGSLDGYTVCLLWSFVDVHTRQDSSEVVKFTINVWTEQSPLCPLQQLTRSSHLDIAQAAQHQHCPCPAPPLTRVRSRSRLTPYCWRGVPSHYCCRMTTFCFASMLRPCSPGA
ncbi:Uncharacterized protein HZ326_19586 [Fusarium oxysporum f. sp. albedinis]|nr:Uncharacterized protein HZ326_19586 [Fusarium oxysporum f. sp. albedinis]